MDWKKLLAYITGSMDEELLLRNAYLATENRILQKQVQCRLRLTDGERRVLVEIGGRQRTHHRHVAKAAGNSYSPDLHLPRQPSTLPEARILGHELDRAEAGTTVHVRFDP